MDITPKQVLDLAAKYIGYKEKASNKDLYSFDGNAAVSGSGEIISGATYTLYNLYA